MNSRQIQVFLTAACCRSFAEAASRCYLSSASVCRSIAVLGEPFMMLEDLKGFRLIAVRPSVKVHRHQYLSGAKKL